MSSHNGAGVETGSSPDLRGLLGSALVRGMVPGAPKYLGMRNAIMDMVRSGHWKAGDKLPPEQQMVTMTGLSLGTVQRALRILAQEGVLERTQGRGTFIAAEHSALRDPWHFRFLDDDGALLPVFTHAVARTVIEPDGEAWTQAFPVTRRFIRLERLLDVNREFQCYNFFYLEQERFAQLGEVPLGELSGVNLKHVLIDQFATAVHRLRHRISADAAPDSVAQAIGLPQHATCLVIEVFAYGFSTEAIYYQITYIPPSRRKLAPIDTVVRSG